MKRTFLPFLWVGVAVVALAWALPWLNDATTTSDASATTFALGKKLYAERCASCHGSRLEGQADWKSPLPSGRLPAPPHDASGHTWHHSDGVLFRVTRDGPAAVVGGGYESDMPAFGNILSDEDILAVLAFIKSTWPERQRAYQAELSRREQENTK